MIKLFIENEEKLNKYKDVKVTLKISELYDLINDEIERLFKIGDLSVGASCSYDSETHIKSIENNEEYQDSLEIRFTFDGGPKKAESFEVDSSFSEFLDDTLGYLPYGNNTAIYAVQQELEMWSNKYKEAIKRWEL